MGFADADRAERLLSEDLALDPEGADADLLASLAAAADPDLALTTLARMPLSGDLLAALRADAGLRSRLTAVLGASAALGDHLARHPADWQVLSGPDALRSPGAAELRADLLLAVGAKPGDPEPVADPAGAQGRNPATALRLPRLPAAAAAPGRPRPDRHPHPGRDRGRAGRPGRGGPGGGAGHRPLTDAPGRGPGPAGRDRHGQMRRPRAQLRQRRGRDLRRRTRRAGRTAADPAGYLAHPPGRARAPRTPRRPRCVPPPSWPRA